MITDYWRVSLLLPTENYCVDRTVGLWLALADGINGNINAVVVDNSWLDNFEKYYDLSLFP